MTRQRSRPTNWPRRTATGGGSWPASCRPAWRTLPRFYKIERVDDPQLAARMARLAEGTVLLIEGVYRMDLSRESVKANAMLTGLGRTRRVILGDTLLTNFTADEIEVILAHE